MNLKVRTCCMSTVTRGAYSFYTALSGKALQYIMCMIIHLRVYMYHHYSYNLLNAVLQSAISGYYNITTYFTPSHPLKRKNRTLNRRENHRCKGVLMIKNPIEVALNNTSIKILTLILVRGRFGSGLNCCMYLFFLFFSLRFKFTNT